MPIASAGVHAYAYKPQPVRVPHRTELLPLAHIYKIVPLALWRAAELDGTFNGAPVDLADGYIHFSTADRVPETAAKHFAGQENLVIVAVDADALRDALKCEPSRGGALFPHLYGKLPMTAVRWVRPLPLGDGGTHVFPDLSG